jgi:hypothetical protein
MFDRGTAILNQQNFEIYWPQITCCINCHLNESIIFHQRLLCVFTKSVKIRKNTLIVFTYRSNENPSADCETDQLVWKWQKMPSQILSKSPIKMQILPIAFQSLERYSLKE